MKENKNFKRLVIFTMVTMMCMTVLAVGCYGECCGELPNNGQSAGGINMADNEVLYHFNNQSGYGESGTYIHDFSGSGHYGNVPTGKSAGYVPNGKFCGAVEFDGTHTSDHRIFIKDGMEFWDNAEHWSVIMWINASATHRNIIGKVGSCTPWIWIGNNYRIGFASFYGVSPSYTEGVSSTLPYAVDPNQWTHLVMTRNGTNLSVYKNGVLHTSLTATTTQNGNLGGVGDLQIGACGSSCCRLKGLLDELAFFSRTLSPDEIYNMYEWNGDGTPPTTTKAYGVPFYTDGVDDWITTATPITLTAVDEGLCAYGVMEIRYNYGDGWMVAPGDTVTFIMPDECTHLIEYYSVDNVGNTEMTKSQIVNVDGTPPELHKEHPEHEYYVDPITGLEYLKCCAPIGIWAEDLPSCACGVAGIYWGFSYEGVWHPTDPSDNYGGNAVIYYFNGKWWFTYDENLAIRFEEECIHVLEYFTLDNLGNFAGVYEQTYHVDNTPPTLTKTHPDEYEAINDTAGWIKVCAKITLEAEDEGTDPCISGVEDIYWGFSHEGVWHPTDSFDNYDGNIVGYYKDDKWWYIYDDVKKIHFLEVGKHTLEYWTKDNVCNTGSVHKQIYWANICQGEVWVDDDAESSWYNYNHVDSIQLAIDRLCEGGTIFAYDGVYFENILIDKALTLKAVYENIPVIDGMLFENCINIISDNVNILDFTIQNGSGYGIEMFGVSNILITNCTFKDNNDGGINVVDLSKSKESSNININLNFFEYYCPDPGTPGIAIIADCINPVEAKFNWYGQDNGPGGNTIDYYNGYIADGLGSHVTGNLTFYPWLGIKAEISVSSTSVILGESILFSGGNSVHYDSNGVLSDDIEYDWYLGNGQFQFLKTFGYTFDSAGVFKVSLHTRAFDSELDNDNNYLDDLDIIYISVSEKGEALGADADPEIIDGDGGNGYTGTTDLPVHFYGIATGGVAPYTYHWDFGNGDTSIEQNPVYLYKDSGEYTVTFTVTDSEGNIATDTTVAIIEDGEGENPEPEPVTIENVIGGFGLKATVINPTDKQVDWSVSIEGKLVFRGSASGTIKSDSQEIIKTGFVLGIGKIEITIKADETMEKRSAFMLGPFFLNVRETQ